MTLLTRLRHSRIVVALIETFGFSPLLATATALFLFLLGGAAILWVVLSAPPRAITMVSGPPGSTFERYAGAYRQALQRHGITLRIVPSAGSSDNLRRLQAPGSGIDVGFVQGGLVGDPPPPGLVSLGSVSFQPLLIFYRAREPISLLAQLAGRRIGIDVAGSGTQALARALLEANGITGPPTTLVPEAGEAAGRDLLAGRLDAIFLMGDSAPIQTLRTLAHAPDVRIYSFTQADAYTRHFPYLNKIVLPEGSIDFGRNLPATDTVLVGPTVELVARRGLNSAISDLLLEVAQQVHGKPGLLARRGEFPAPIELDLPISSDARRFYKSGKGFTYQLVSSFWLASLINRVLVAIVPVFLILIPAVRLLPVAYRWSVQLRIYRNYRPLLHLERDATAPLAAGRGADLERRLDAIERDVNAMKVPASFASQYYDLRNHVAFVRQRLRAAIGATPAP
jgi:TRAP-type uncharacterized transport system substrate-binding protein